MEHTNNDNPNDKRKGKPVKAKSFIDELFVAHNKDTQTTNNRIKKVKFNENIVMIIDRLNIYKDFVLSLLYYLNKYYISDGSFNKKDEKNFHLWCYNKVCDDFLMEGLDFKGNTFLEEYFYKYHEIYFFDELYRDIDGQVTFWKNFFNMNKIQNKTNLTNLVNLYVLFSSSIDYEFDDIIKESEKTMEKSLNI